jgi:regulatory protein
MAGAGRIAGRRAAAEARRARRADVTDADVVMDAAAAFLAVRPRSVAETRRRLRQMGFPSSLGDGVVDRLIQLGYLDDHAFARAWVESRDRARPRGVLALRQELQRKGVASEVTDAILAERGAGPEPAAAEADGSDTSDADVAAARRLLARRERTLSREADPRRRRQKAYALLARNGFTPDVCTLVVSSDTSGSPEGETGS